MGRRSKGARLYLRKDEGTWIIRHLNRSFRTGFLEHEKDAAEEMLRQYLSGDLKLGGETAGAIYFISADRRDYPIKIGFTSGTVANRMTSIQSAHPYELICLGYFPGTADTEREIHHRFHIEHLRGEWFARSNRLLRYIQDNCATAPECTNTAEPIANKLSEDD